MSLPNPNFRPVYESPITTLDGAIDDSQTTITLTSVADIGDHPNILVIWETGKREIVKYDSEPTGNVLTVERGYGDSTANSFGSGASVSRVLSYLDIENLQLNQEYLDGKLPVGDVVGTSDVQTLTGKVIDGDDNTIQDLSYSAIKATSRSGNEGTLITGTKGTDGNLAKWNVDGDLVDGKTPPTGDILGTTDTQVVTNKTIDANSNSITNIGSSEIDEDIITGLTELETPADNSDLLLIYDTDVETLKKISINNLPFSGGDVTGDTSSTDNAIARFDGITGKAIQNTAVTIDDSGSINIPAGQTYNINGTELVGLPSGTQGDILYKDDSAWTVLNAGTEGQLLKLASNLPSWDTLDGSDVGLGNVTNDAQLKREAGDIITFTEKASPVDTDILLIEDSADSNNKKKIQIGNLPFSGMLLDDAWVSKGDLVVGNAENEAVIVPIGSDNQFFKSHGSGVIPSWETLLQSDVSGLTAALSEKATKTTATQLIYVDKAATGAGDGTSWTDAFTTIQAAVGSLATIIENTVSIYIRKGATPYNEAISFSQITGKGTLNFIGEYFWSGECASATTPSATKFNITATDGSNISIGDHIVVIDGTSDYIDSTIIGTVDKGSDIWEIEINNALPTGNIGSGDYYTIVKTIIENTGSTMSMSYISAVNIYGLYLDAGAFGVFPTQCNLAIISSIVIGASAALRLSGTCGKIYVRKSLLSGGSVGKGIQLQGTGASIQVGLQAGNNCVLKTTGASTGLLYVAYPNEASIYNTVLDTPGGMAVRCFSGKTVLATSTISPSSRTPATNGIYVTQEGYVQRSNVVNNATTPLTPATSTQNPVIE